MQYPNQLITTEEGLTIYVPVSEQVKLTYEKLCQLNESTAFPYWAKIWPAAKSLSAFLKAEPGWILGKRVLEIGAGIGLPSLLVAPLTRSIVITDKAAAAVELLEKNIAHLGYTNAQVLQLDWNDFPMVGEIDTVLLSDINYEPGQFAPLLQLIKRLVEQGVTIILATPQRITASPFAEAIKYYIKRSFLLPVKEANKVVDIQVLILSANSFV